MTTLLLGAGPNDKALRLDSVLAIESNYPFPITVDLENMSVIGKRSIGAGIQIRVERGLNGTRPVSHLAGATITPGWGGGSGGVTVDNGSDPPAAVTNIVAVGAVIDEGTATLAVTLVDVSLMPSWEANHAYASGDLVVFTHDVSAGSVVLITFDAGTSGGSGPAFTDPISAWWDGIADNDLTWYFYGFNGKLPISNLPGQLQGLAMGRINGQLQLVGLPTSDPGVGSRIWNDGGTLKITAVS